MFNFKHTLFFTFLMVLINNVNFCTSDDFQEPISGELTSQEKDELRAVEPDNSDDTTTTKNEAPIPVPSGNKEKTISPKHFAKGLTLLKDDYTEKLDTVRRLVNESLVTQGTKIKNMHNNIEEIQGKIKDLRDDVVKETTEIDARLDEIMAKNQLIDTDISRLKRDVTALKDATKAYEKNLEETTARLNNYSTMLNTSNATQKAAYDEQIGALAQKIADLEKAPSINPNVLQKQAEEATRRFLVRDDLPWGSKVNDLIKKDQNKSWSTASSTIEYIVENKGLFILSSVVVLHLINYYFNKSILSWKKK